MNLDTSFFIKNLIAGTIDYLKEIKKAKKLWNFSCKVVNNNYILDKSGGVTLEIADLKKFE